VNTMSPIAVLMGALGMAHILRMLIPIAFGFLAIYWLLPRPRPLPPPLGWLAVAMALLLMAAHFLRSGLANVETLLFCAFSLIAVVSGGCLVTLKNPVYGALSFALAVLSTCGLFLLQAAPFLMAATIIVYAGAIIVTFMFVIMLAQQEGPSDADSRSREPFLAAVTGFLLLAALLGALQAPADLDAVDPFARLRWGVSEFSRIKGAALDRAELPAGNVAYLGRALFTDYLLAVEIGGTLLLTATIGAILIASRRPEGKQ
jgi:NADH-quinone oxidoreductase subunit J